MTPKQLDINSARKQIVRGILEYIKEINNHHEFENEFINWPFEPKNLQYTLKVDRGDGIGPRFPGGLGEDLKISYVIFLNDEIHYLIYTKPDILPETVHSETLDEAIDILKAEGWNEPIE